jgi:hypothetical protein
LTNYFAFFDGAPKDSVDPILVVFDELFAPDFKINTAQGEKTFDEWRETVIKMGSLGMKIADLNLEEDGEKGLKWTATGTLPGGEPTRSAAVATLNDKGQILYIQPVEANTEKLYADAVNTK